jgi:hypothetical protein
MSRGHRVLKMTPCLKRMGAHLAAGIGTKPQVIFGGREVLNHGGRPMSLQEFNKIMVRCEMLHKTPVTAPKNTDGVQRQRAAGRFSSSLKG